MISVIIPSKDCKYLKYSLWSLREQTTRPSEVILVLKDCDIRYVEELCRQYGFSCVILEQREGYFTHALNMGKREARSDILVFTDDDAIPPPKWLEKYVRLHEMYRKVAGISSRDIYLDLETMRLLGTPDDRLTVRLYRWFIRPWLEPPHPALRCYRLGVYITRNADVAHGPYIPYQTCYSLPFRGVNMSFKSEYVYDVWFPEHSLLKRAPGNEQYFGLQLILKGYNTIYTPNNPVLHIVRESLSRTGYGVRLENEVEVMKHLIKRLLEKAQQ